MSNHEDFKRLHDQWMLWFNSDDAKCILQQVQFMLFDTMIYKIVLKAREISPRDRNGVIKLNGAVHWLLDKCFFNNQLMIVRRLTDSGSDTVSLRKLLDVMDKHRTLLTRENYFTLNKYYVYDYSEIKRKHDEYLSKNLKYREVIATPEELDWIKSEQLHADFDVLSGTKKENRSRCDIISDSVFKNLIFKLDSCKNIKTHVDHFIAHTLKKEKREKLNENEAQITYRHLWEVQKIICEVTKFVGLYLLNRIDYCLLIIPPYTFLDYIELPLVDKSQIAMLSQVEDDFRNETNNWLLNLSTIATPT